MKFEAEINKYLSGSKFSNGLLIPISSKETTCLDRLTILERISLNKDIIHLGCTDHLPLIKKKLENDTWLHARLCRSAKRCLGIDINCPGINYLQNELGYEDVICANFLNDEIPTISEQKWDYMILGEILEHIDNPVILLTTIAQKYGKNVDKLVITVPNAFCWLNFRYALKHREFINSDHRYWFTPYTLGKVATLAGLKIVDFQFCEGYPPNKLNWKGRLRRYLNLKNMIIKRYPALRETLVMELAF